MLLDLTKSYMKYMVPSDGNEDLFHFTGKDEATEEEKQSLIDLDEVYAEINSGTHLIDNYEDLR